MSSDEPRPLKPIFVNEKVPVYINQDLRAHGHAEGYLDPTTNKLHLDIEIPHVTEEKLALFTQVIKTHALAFVGIASEPASSSFTTEVLPRAHFFCTNRRGPGGVIYKVIEGVPSPIFLNVVVVPEDSTTKVFVGDRQFQTNGIKSHREALLELGFKLDLDSSHIRGLRKNELMNILDEYARSKDDIQNVVNELWRQ